MGKLEEAREAYKDALRLDPRDRDAKFNIEVIDRMLGIQPPPQQQQQPGQSGPPDKGQPGQQGEQGQQGQGQPGEMNASGDQPGPPGSEGPQAAGPPTSASEQVGPSLAEALRQFRSALTAEDALRLLDALLREQHGVEVLIEGQAPQGSPRPGQPRPDPSY
jgi:tetratricopeptide (TPR) repeat protein